MANAADCRFPGYIIAFQTATFKPPTIEFGTSIFIKKNDIIQHHIDS